MAPRAALLPRDWAPEYLRNNKTNGRKNLRCFPQCTPGKGHRDKGFCGHSVEVEVVMEDEDAGVRLLGEFCVVGQARWRLGEEVRLADLDAAMGIKDSNLIEARSSAQIFCFLPHGWTYHHRLSRYAPSMHTFQIYVLEPSLGDSKKLVVVEMLSSPTFKLLSRRKTGAGGAGGSNDGITFEDEDEMEESPRTSAATSRSKSALSPTMLAPPSTSASLTSPSSDEIDNDEEMDDEDLGMDDEYSSGPKRSALMDGVRWLLERVPVVHSLSSTSTSPSPPDAASGQPGAAASESITATSWISRLGPMLRIEPVPFEERRKRPLQPEIDYEGFLAQAPQAIDGFLQSIISGITLAPSLHTDDLRLFRSIGSIGELEMLLPPGLNLKMILKPVPMTLNDDFPDLSGTWWVSDDMFLAELNVPRFTWIGQWVTDHVIASDDRIAVSRRSGWNVMEIELPFNKVMSTTLFRFPLDASIQEFRVAAPLLAGYFHFTTQAWLVGPMAVLRMQNADSVRCDRCFWKGHDGVMRTMFIYQSVGGHGWGGEVLDRGLAILGESEWVVNRVKFGIYEACPVDLS